MIFGYIFKNAKLVNLFLSTTIFQKVKHLDRISPFKKQFNLGGFLSVSHVFMAPGKFMDNKLML